jgi:hypothetical protein
VETLSSGLVAVNKLPPTRREELVGGSGVMNEQDNKNQLVA